MFPQNKIAPIIYVPFVTIVLLIFATGFGFLSEYLQQYNTIWQKSPYQDMPLRDQIMAAFFIAPIFETLLHQYLPIKLLQRFQFFKQNNLYLIVISAFTFALVHLYSLFYMVYTFLAGVVFAYSYILYQKDKKFTAFWVVTIIHSLFNIGIFFLMKIIK